MGINQILFDEQIAMMLQSSATLPVEIRKNRYDIGRLAGEFSLFFYPHRPYLAPDRAMTLSKSAQAQPRASIACWENEGGAC
jgi:hypothetical protein